MHATVPLTASLSTRSVNQFLKDESSNGKAA